MANFHELGKAGEELAISHLKSKGFEILETNWRKGSLEIDIIARKGPILAIVEVKSRSTNVFGEPEEFVTKSKQKNLVKAANSFVIQKNLEVETRFDIISVLTQGSNYKIYHIEDAFYPTL